MRIVAISRVLDEADIIEAFVRHTASFVDHHIFMDNGSKDGTQDILALLRDEGLKLSVFQNGCVSFNEANHLTFLFREAVTNHGADWVACLDVDEFLDDRQSPAGLGALLRAVASDRPDADCIKLPTVDYIATSEDDAGEPIVPARIRRRREVTDNYKVIVRGGPEYLRLNVLSGGHGIHCADRPDTAIIQTMVRLAHYSERSAFQYITKFVRGWSRVLAAGAATVDSGLAHHYRSPYELLRDRPADLLGNPWFMGFKNETPDLTFDPIRYSGGPLRYTKPETDAMRAVRSLMGTLDGLALRHGALLDAFPEVRRYVGALDSEHRKIL